jgi:HK97 gp10 family phage protein
VSATIELKGLKELEEKLVKLGAVAGQKVLRKAGRKAMKPVLDEAKRLAPVSDDGGPHLRDAIDIVVKNAGDGDTISTSGIRIKKLPAKVRRFLKAMRKRGVALAHPSPRRYWHLVEFGTRHSRAQPFIRPAFDSNVRTVLEIERAELAKGIDRALKNQSPEGA